MRPLYRDAATVEVFSRDGNTGLLYDKFCDKWPEVNGEVKWSLQSDKQDKRGINPKQEWIDAVTGFVGESKALREACERLSRLGKTVFDVEPMTFKTEWRFVTGLGRQHPVENGFAWHHTLGVPYLPGSSVKGMVCAWANSWEENVKVDDIKRIFGPEDTEYAGNVIFFDALPDSRIRLEMDVMTPHYAPYYSDGNIPGDWYDPVPIPFLTVGSGQTFQFIVAPRRPKNERSRQDAVQASEWLGKALEWIGAGAKTAIGYGRFGKVNKTCPWVDEKLKEIANTTHCQTEEALRGRALANAWNELNDATLKAEALEDIKSRWQEKGWWDAPRGRAMVLAKNTYDPQD